MGVVYIKDMKMPSSGTYEASIDVTNSNGKTAISVYLRDENDSRRFSVGVYEAVHVPPHGRLGDLDKLEKMFADIDSAPYSCFDGAEPFYSAEDAAQIIRLAPTVIPADLAEEGE